MGFMGPNISDILLQKVQEIQSRLPIQMTLTGDLKASFSSALSEATAAAAANQEHASSPGPTADASASGFTASASGLEASLSGLEASSVFGVSSPASKYASTSGTFPKLDADQIQAIMPRIDAAIAENAADTGIDPKLIRALIRQETSFQPFSISTAGAMGLTQLMPGTASGLGITDPYNIEDNIRGGTMYLKQQFDTFGEDPALALAAYNAGPNAVKEYGGVPPYAETKDFIQKVLSYYNMYRAVGQ